MDDNNRKTVRQVPAIEYGTVIDHLPAHMTLTIVKILSQLDDLVTIGINLTSKCIGRKGVVKISNKQLSQEEVAKIALIAPEATISIIESYGVVKKFQVTPPDRVEGFVRCGNPNCITNHENVTTRFSVDKTPKGRLRLTCYYCERFYVQEEIEIV